jgi:hypothetical protein
MRNIIFVLCCLVYSNSLRCQTNVSGGIFSDTTWTLAGSPYTATDDVIVMSGVTLKIEAGVRVKFNDKKGLEVRGNLRAIGKLNDTIYFTSAYKKAGSGQWSGISFNNKLEMDYVKISYANAALLNNYNREIILSHSRLDDNIIGLSSLGSNSFLVGHIDSTQFDFNTVAIRSVNDAKYISNCSFINNETGIGYVYNVLITNCLFAGNTDRAIDGYGANYINNVFKYNNIGLVIKLYNSSFLIKDNTFSDNYIGILARGDATLTPNKGFYNNTICNNYKYNVENTDNISIYMQNNCWCTTDSSKIAQSIHDAYDSLTVGVVSLLHTLFAPPA